MLLARASLEFVAVDLLGKFIQRSRAGKCLLVITDRFSRLFQTVPLKKIITRSVAEALFRHWVLVYRLPVNILLENGREFVRRFFQDFCRVLDEKNFITTNYHPQCHGRVERSNCTLLSVLGADRVEHPRTWHIFMDTTTYASNTKFHKVTGLSALGLVFSRSPPPVAVELQPFLDRFPSTTDQYTQWKNWLTTIVPLQVVCGEGKMGV